MPYVNVTSSALTLSTRVLQIDQTQAGRWDRAFGPKIERPLAASLANRRGGLLPYPMLGLALF